MCATVAASARRTRSRTLRLGCKSMRAFRNIGRNLTSPALAAIDLILLAYAAPAQTWPARPVTLVVTYAAGGTNDIIARVLAPRLSEILGQQVVIENVGGAGGMSGAARVAKAPPDGYQFVLGNVGTHAQNQTLYRSPLYNAATDFAPVGLLVDLPMVMVTRLSLPTHDLPEFIAYAKANQAKMQYGSTGTG